MKKQSTGPRRRRFERIVVLVDITVVLLQHEPKLFAAHIFNSVSRILQQCNEHSKFSTMWGYKFFDPCFPHMTARSKIGEYLGGAPMFERFDAFAPTLEKFGKVLDLMSKHYRQYDSGGVRGKHIASAMREVIGNGQYTWDPFLASDSSSSDEENKRSLASKDRLGDSNAIVLFSSVPTTWSDVNCFFDVARQVGDDLPDPSARGVLSDMFRKLRDSLKNSNIQVCFVDVPMRQDLWSDDRLDSVLKPTPGRSLVLKSLSGLVKTVIASELLVVSPALLPCNLVWNSMADLSIDKSKKRTYARVLCNKATFPSDVQLQPFNSTHALSSSQRKSVLKPMLFPAPGKLDIVLNSVVAKSAVNMKPSSERCLVQQSSRAGAPPLGDDRDSFGDKILQLLDQSAFLPGQPAWQLLLLSLASQKSVCEVSLCNQESGHSLKAVLEPFTSHSAILTVFEAEITPTHASGPDSTHFDGVTTDGKEKALPSEIVSEVKSRGDAADYRKHEGVTIIQSRKRRKIAARDVAPVINWQEYWDREVGVSGPMELKSDGGTLVSRYFEAGKASQLLRTVDSFLKEDAQPMALDTASVPCLAGTVELEGVEPPSEQIYAPAALPDIVTLELLDNATAALSDNATIALPDNATTALPDSATPTLPDIATPALSPGMNLGQDVEALSYFGTLLLKSGDRRPDSGQNVETLAYGEVESHCSRDRWQFLAQNVDTIAYGDVDQWLVSGQNEDSLQFGGALLPQSGDPWSFSEQNANTFANYDVQLHQPGDLSLLAGDVQRQPCAAPVDVEDPAHDGDLTPSSVRQTACEEAKEYINSVGRKIEHYLSSTDVDSQRFAEMLAAESQRCLCVLARQSEDDEQIPAGEQRSATDSNKKIVAKLKRLLLIRPKKLLSKYKVSGSTDWILDEKGFREHELQILLRLEMIKFDKEQLLEPSAKDQMVDDICEVLDSIQLHRIGGLFGGKNLSEYCSRLLVSRYGKTLTSTVAKIFSMMEFDGYAGLPPPHSGPESHPEASLKAALRTSDLLLGEAGLSQDGTSCSEKVSSSANGDVRLGSSDADVQPAVERDCKRKRGLDDRGLRQPHIMDKEQQQKKKGFYHFASHASGLLRMRKFKSIRKQTSTVSRLSYRPARPLALPGDDVQIVCQTPAPPVTSTKDPLADHVTEPGTYKQMTVWSPAHERGTPVVKKKLPLPSFAKENPRRGDSAVEKRLANADTPSNAVSYLPASFPFNLGRSSFVTETDKPPMLSQDPPCIEDNISGNPPSFSALFNGVGTVPPKMIEAAGDIKSHVGSHVFQKDDRDDDDGDDIEDDDDDDGVVSTPFKINPSDQSLTSLQSNQSDHPDCLKQLDLFSLENTRDGTSLPFPWPAPSSKPSLPVCPPYANAMGDNSISHWGSSEPVQLSENDSSSRSSPEASFDHQKALHKDSSPKHKTRLQKKLRSSPTLPRKALSAILINSTQPASTKQSSTTEVCSVSDTARRDSLGDTNADESASRDVHDKENQLSLPRKNSTKCRPGPTSTAVCERKTRSRTLMEQNAARAPVSNAKRRTRRNP